MSIFKPLRWLRRSRRWHRFLTIFLIVLLIQPLSDAQAQRRRRGRILPTIFNAGSATYVEQTSGETSEITSNRVRTGTNVPLIDPAGDLLGCDGEPLANYTGFSMTLYEADASGLDLIEPPLPLTTTQAPPAGNGIAPNTTNVNPFFLLPDSGRYNFLLDPARRLQSGLAQTDEDATYVLVITPPVDSTFGERRVRIRLEEPLVDDNGNILALSYQAVSLDGQPISVDGATELTKTVQVENAETNLLTFFEFGLDTAICEANQVQITKTADRSAGQPGDVVVYRLNIKNVAKAAVNSIFAYDTPPVGFELLSDSVSAEVDGVPIEVATDAIGNGITFSTDAAIELGQSLNVIYALRITPDALRGSGRNSATVTAKRVDSGFTFQDGPSNHRITLDPGLLADCGTLIGRVFEDKDFDGEQQPGEAGIPNAVIFLDDGNRIVTDADGLFSVQKMLPGQRTGTLDLSSLPGYTLATNLHFNERNSLSRLVNLAPGGLVRMNFGVTPTFQEEPAQ